MKFLLPLFILCLFCLLPTKSFAAYERAPQKPAVVVSAFGTTDEEALQSILNIKNRIAAAFPSYDIHLAFTSNFIRDIWHQRNNDKEYRKAHKNIPEEVYKITNPLTVMAQIQERGSRLIIVQSLHVTAGEEYGDLKSIVKQLYSIETMKFSLKPFPWLALGKPALGYGEKEDLERAAKSLAPLATEAKISGAALVLMGHGNEHKELDVYGKLEKILVKMYDLPVYIGLVEGNPGFDDVLKRVHKDQVKKIILAPLMVVAGDHAKNDMASADDPESWYSQFKVHNIEIKVHLEGLGSNNDWADIYVENLKEAEKEALAQQVKKP